MEQSSNEFNPFEYFEDDDIVDDAFGVLTWERVTVPMGKKENRSQKVTTLVVWEYLIK